MNIRIFVALTLFFALLICAAAYLTRPGNLVIVTHSAHDPSAMPGAYFIPEHRSDGRIDCPIAFEPDWAAVWEREPALCSLEYGWTPAQSWGTWATGPRSTVLFELDHATSRTLVVRVRSNPDLPPEQPQSMRIGVNGRLLPSQPVSQSWRPLRFEIPADALRVGSNEIAFEFAARISPQDAGNGKDHRTLAARIGEITLIDPASETSSDSGPRPAADLWDAGRNLFFVPGAGRLVIPVVVPAGVSELELSLRASASVDLDALELAIEVADLDGDIRDRAEVMLRPPSRSTEARVDVRGIAGRWAIVAVVANPAYGQLEVSPVRFLGPDSDNQAPSAAPPNPPPSAAPDIVLITLDAARSDRFSFSGYGRPTTPFIDELAADSLVFSNAFALAPYTLCSVPTMITGMSFLDHGVVAHEDVLSQEAVTLAEVLRDSGYRTACFSATPNNSKAKGFDQGYEVFREVWTEGPQKESRRAHFIAEKVVEWLESADDDGRPLHLQVHMVPPHAPYDPQPPFDRFTESGYDGPCNGFGKTLSGLDGGSLAPSRECLDHVGNLYDGNLSVADDATRIIVEALRSRPRWRNTVVLVTSDHGEALFEHRRMDHNSTLFREMLQVPFVLRMPAGFDTSGIDTEGLVTLADIVPTLLGAAGIEAPAVPDGIDLLEPGADRRDRPLVARTADIRPVIGLRTLAWNMTLDAGGSGALFDLEADSGEEHNIALVDAATFAGLGNILTWRVGQPPRLVAAPETADITDEERALLETLGYVR